MFYKAILLSCATLSLIGLTACGGGSGGASSGGGAVSVTPPPSPPPPPAPVLNISEGTTDFPSNLTTEGLLDPNGSVTGTIERSGDADGFRYVITQRATVLIELSGNTLQEAMLFIQDDQGSPVALDGQQLTSINGQLMAANPSPNQSIEITLNPGTYLVAATAPLFSDSTGTYTLSSTVTQIGGPDPDDLTVTGTISKGILANADVTFYAVILDVNGNVVTLGETVTDENGNYEAVISRSAAGSAFYVASTLSNATTICDAPLGCGTTAFGDQFTYADDGITVPASPTPAETFRNGNLLISPVATPLTAPSVNQNVNIFTSMIFANIDIEQDSFASNFAVVSTAQLNATSRVTELFGIGSLTNIDIPFVDITQPVTEADSGAIKAAILAGGMQAVMAEGIPDQVYSNFLTDLFLNGGEFLIREGIPTSATVSLEDIYVAALDIETVNNTTSNAYTLALQSIRDDLALFQAAAANSRTIDGEIQ